jgi:hypothetical protein
MRNPYICPYCDQRSTRRWNLQIHIKRRHGYLPGGSSGRFMANNPPLYNKSVQSGHTTVADSVGDAFQPRYMHQQAPLRVSQNFANPNYRSMPTMDKSFETGLSIETIQKIEELKGLMNKYPQYHPNPDGIIRWASIKGNNRFLDEKLEQLRRIDSLANNQLRFL